MLVLNIPESVGLTNHEDAIRHLIKADVGHSWTWNERSGVDWRLEDQSRYL